MSTPGKFEYTKTEAGVIHRRALGDPTAKPVGIATIDGENVVRWAHPDYARYRGPVVQMLKAQGIEKATFAPIETREPVMREATHVSTIDTSNTPPPVSTDAPAQDPDGVDGMRGLTVDQRKAVNQLRAREGYPLGELERPVPPEPRQNSGAGDKSPEYVRWLLRYHPRQFVERYGVVRVGPIEVTIPSRVDPETGVKTPARREWQGKHALARRKTIFTELLPNAHAEQGSAETE